jgi:predicted regulator of Ras-like GTPase activity (Roadblock/LC7/MglB family)
VTRQPSSENLVAELRSLRERVMGATDGVVSTADGMLVTADTAALQPESLAALAAATLALARRTAAEAGLGGLRDSVVQANGGYVMVTAVGDNALLAVVGDEGLDLESLRRESRITAQALEELLVDSGTTW